MIALIAIAVVVVAIGGFGGGSHDANTQSSDTTAHLSDAKLGMTEPQIRQIFGDPGSTQHSESDGARTDTWRYATPSAKFEFKNGRLETKSRQ